MMVGSRVQRTLLVSVLLGVLFAGCVDGDDVTPGEDAEGDGPADEPVKLSRINDDEATLLGTIVSDDFVPLAGAEVVVKGTEFQAVTDSNGRYVIEHLTVEPVVVFAQADGYGVTTQHINLRGGQTNSLNFILPTLARATPHVTVVEQSGFIECAYGVAGVSANCIPLQFVFDEIGTNPTGTVTILKWDFAADGLQAIVLELVWNAPADGILAKELLFLAESDSTDITEGETYGRASGPSPVRIELTGEDLPVASDNVTGIFQTRVFPPGELGNVVFQQKYTIFTSLFYHKLPTPGYTGVPDGF